MILPFEGWWQSALAPPCERHRHAHNSYRPKPRPAEGIGIAHPRPLHVFAPGDLCAVDISVPAAPLSGGATLEEQAPGTKACATNRRRRRCPDVAAAAASKAQPERVAA